MVVPSSKAQIITPYMQYQVGGWAVASTPEPFPHIPHTREQGRWTQRSSCWCKNQAVGNPMAFPVRGTEAAVLDVQSSLAHRWETLPGWTTRMDVKPREKSCSNSSCMLLPQAPALHKAPVMRTARSWLTGQLADRAREPERISKWIQDTLGHQILSQYTNTSYFYFSYKQ